MFDILIRGGEVINGRNHPPFPADIGIQGDRVTADVARSQKSATLRKIYEQNHVVSWFIDEPEPNNRSQ